MNNSDHDDCCDKLQEKVIKITLYDKMNYKPIFYDVTIINIPLSCHIKRINSMLP